MTYKIKVKLDFVYEIPKEHLPTWAVPEGVEKLVECAIESHVGDLTYKDFGNAGILGKEPVSVNLDMVLLVESPVVEPERLGGVEFCDKYLLPRWVLDYPFTNNQERMFFDEWTVVCAFRDLSGNTVTGTLDSILLFGRPRFHCQQTNEFYYEANPITEVGELVWDTAEPIVAEEPKVVSQEGVDLCERYHIPHWVLDYKFHRAKSHIIFDEEITCNFRDSMDRSYTGTLDKLDLKGSPRFHCQQVDTYYIEAAPLGTLLNNPVAETTRAHTQDDIDFCNKHNLPHWVLDYKFHRTMSHIIFDEDVACNFRDTSGRHSYEGYLLSKISLRGMEDTPRYYCQSVDTYYMEALPVDKATCPN
jgi:hypothetical protein